MASGGGSAAHHQSQMKKSMHIRSRREDKPQRQTDRQTALFQKSTILISQSTQLKSKNLRDSSAKRKAVQPLMLKSGESFGSFRLDSAALTVKQNKTMMTTNTGVNLQNLQVTSSIPTKISRVKLQTNVELLVGRGDVFPSWRLPSPSGLHVMSCEETTQVRTRRLHHTISCVSVNNLISSLKRTFKQI